MAQADRSHFEQEWENAFADARRKPSPKVWNGIERSLHGGHSTRKRMFLIQLAMAASVLFAMSIGAAGVYQVFFAGEETGKKIVAADSTAETETVIPLKENDSSENTAVNGQTRENDTILKNSGAESDVRDSDSGHNSPYAAQLSQADATNKSQAPMMPELVEGSVKSSFTSDFEEIDPFASQLAFASNLPEVSPHGVPELYVKKDRSSGNSGWASVGFSAGSYNAGSASRDMYMLGSSFDSNNLSVGRVSEESSGSVFQVEMNFGKKLAEKWFVQGGLGYMERNSQGTSNLISAQGNSVADMALAESRQVVVSEPYRLDNSMQLLTVPVQVGYILLDHKVGLRLLTGIANEVMIKYQIQDSDGNLGSQSIRAGESDEYNAYGMSALVTTEISYALADHYQVALFPQMRKSLMTLRETDGDLPVSLEIGFRVRYLID